MTDPGPHKSPSAPALPTRLVIAVSVLGLALFAALGFVVGTKVTDRRHELGGWHTAIAHVGARQISIRGDGWTYGATGSVNAWIDHAGSWHDSGWPDCLRVPPGRDVPVRFAAHEVTVDDISWRPIVAIDCRAND